jgi:hypothetical protein
MSLDAAIDGLRAAVATMTGLTRVYTDPPESLNEFPCAFVVADSGEMSDSGAGGYSLHTLAVEVFHSRTVIAQAVDGAKVWPDRMFAALRADPRLGGSVSHVRWPMTWQAGALTYNGITHYGMRFRITVKVNE